jgi:hypothetical protein
LAAVSADAPGTPEPRSCASRARSSTQAEMPMATSNTSAVASPATTSHRETIRVRRAMVTVVSVKTAAIRIA